MNHALFKLRCNLPAHNGILCRLPGIRELLLCCCSMKERRMNIAQLLDFC